MEPQYQADNGDGKLVQDTESTNATENDRQKEKHYKPSYINWKNNMSTSDSIAYWQLVVNFISLLAGIIICIVAFGTLWSALNANAISENNYKLAKESYDSSAKESKARFEMDSKNAQAQIHAMEEQVRLTKEQFEISNRPILTYGNLPGPVFINYGQPITGSYNVINVGQIPTKVHNHISTSGFQDINSINGAGINKFKQNIRARAAGGDGTTAYMGAHAVFPLEGRFNHNPTVEEIDNYSSGKNAFCIGGIVIYEDVLSKKKWEFIYMVQFPNGGVVISVIQENNPLPNP